MTMEDESTGASLMINWLTKLTRKITSGKIVPMHYGENLSPAVADSVKNARAVWVVCLTESTFDVDGLFASCAGREVTVLSPARNKRRIMFPCPVHNELASDAQADVIRRSKLAQNWGLDVKWVDHENLQSMIIINPPTEHDPSFGDGVALIDLSLPHLGVSRAKFEITQEDQEKIFSDLVRSFSHTWGTAHDPCYEETKTLHHEIKTKRLLKGIFVA
jgi:hypothetical protein